MHTFAKPLVEHFKARRAHALKAIFSAAEQNPYKDSPPSTPEASEQMVDGFFGVVADELLETKQGARQLWIDAAGPTVAETGIRDVLFISIHWGLALAADIKEHLASPHRDAALAWFNSFYSAWITDLAHAAIKAKR